MKYTVIGVFTDSEQPWMEQVMAKTPAEAAVAAVDHLSQLNKQDATDFASVVEVVEGFVKGCLKNEVVVTVDELDVPVRGGKSRPGTILRKTSRKR